MKVLPPALMWPNWGSAAIGTPDWGVLATTDNIPRPTASTIKLLTALAVVQTKPIPPDGQGEKLTLNARDVDLYNAELARDGSVVPVKEGEAITERQALEALLLPSANNIASTLALWIYGSMPAYFNAVNQLAISLNMHSTHLVDASGFSSLTTSTPHDLVELGIAALNNPVIASIMSEKSAMIPVAGTIYNINGLLGVDNIIGGKTGNTPEAGGCFIGISHFQEEGHAFTVVSAIMGAPSLALALSMTPPLNSSVEQNTVTTPIVAKGEAIAAYSVPWSTTSFHAIATKEIAPLRWTNQPADIAIHAIPASIGQQSVGELTVILNGVQYTDTLELDRAIPPPPLTWRLLHVF